MKTRLTELDLLADRLRKCYQFERNQLNRQFSRPGDYRVPQLWRGGGREKEGKSVFRQLALFCRNQGIDPVSYVQWCLHPAHVQLGHPPEPNQLLATRKMDAYRDSQPKLHLALKGSFGREGD